MRLLKLDAWRRAKVYKTERRDLRDIRVKMRRSARFRTPFAADSPNPAIRQIWVSALAKSYKLSWAPELGALALNGETLPALIERLSRSHLES